MSWTDRADEITCCDGPLGKVENEEHVARILNSRTAEPAQAAFTRRDLHADGLPHVSNDCGNADGLSVDRCDALDDGELRTRSEAQAALREGRTAEGAVVANVSRLRAVRHPDMGDTQVVFVYDDPRADNQFHAVVRVSHAVPRTEFRLIQREVIKAFDRRVTA